ncbi:MAG: signal peptidase I [Halobacteriovoraceae bacterium]|jgi:signal peptidase I|nr:signal peptidase I [Halobacteriovoraceae bacterium]
MFWKKKKTDDSNLTKKEKFKKEAKSIFWIIFLVLGFRSVFFEPFKIPSGSMIPTLLIGDFILVNKFAYGFKVPFSDWFTDPTYITGPGKPERGDVIVFKYPKDPDLNYIKRVVGLPGDTIQVVDKMLYINDEIVEMVDFDGQKIMDDMDEKYKRFNFKFYKTKTGEHNHITQIHVDNVFTANFPKITVPQGKYFAMGDNRDFSADSRSWGFVPFENIKGRALLVWFSLSLPFSAEETFMFRPWRIGTMIDDAPGLN